jgi:hypothetical protein
LAADFAPWLLVALAAMLVTGCAGPYVDSRREAGRITPVGPSSPDVIAVCHWPSESDRARTLADSECAKTGRTARFDHSSAWSCTLIAPTRAFFRCVTKP